MLTVRNRLKNTTPAHRLVFINAWNEWAEGAVLEPDTRVGYAWLDATRQALLHTAEVVTRSGQHDACVVLHAWYLDVLDEALDALAHCGLSLRLVVTTDITMVTQVRQCLQQRGLQAQVEGFENRGRDILPFLRVANRLLDEGEQVVLKLHTKKSTHRETETHGGATCSLACSRHNTSLQSCADSPKILYSALWRLRNTCYRSPTLWVAMPMRSITSLSAQARMQ